MTRFIQYPFDKTKMAEVREWAKGVGLKDLRAVKGVKNVELSFCPGEGWLAARYILCADAPRTLSRTLSHARARTLSHVLASHALTSARVARAATTSMTWWPSRILKATRRPWRPWPRHRTRTHPAPRTSSKVSSWRRSEHLYPCGCACAPLAVLCRLRPHTHTQRRKLRIEDTNFDTNFITQQTHVRRYHDLHLLHQPSRRAHQIRAQQQLRAPHQLSRSRRG